MNDADDLRAELVYAPGEFVVDEGDVVDDHGQQKQAEHNRKNTDRTWKLVELVEHGRIINVKRGA